MNRRTLIRVADALEELMIETGLGETKDDRTVWWACRPLWILIQKLLRNSTKQLTDTKI